MHKKSEKQHEAVRKSLEDRVKKQIKVRVLYQDLLELNGKVGCLIQNMTKQKILKE